LRSGEFLRDFGVNPESADAGIFEASFAATSRSATWRRRRRRQGSANARPTETVIAASAGTL